jgi:hypothetical protein
MSSVKRSVQIKSHSPEEKQTIIDELIKGVENEYYKPLGNKLVYKESKYRKHASKRHNPFEERVSRKKVGKDITPSIEENDDIPSPTEIITAVAPQNEVERIERAAQPPPIKKRTLDLLREGRQRDLIEKGFIPNELVEKQLGPRKLNFSPS